MSGLSIITGAPLWVWPLLALLVFAGLRSTRERTVPVAMIYALPLLEFLSLDTLVGLPSPLLVFASHVAAYACGFAAGYRIQGGWIIEKRGNEVRLAGEWLTMVVVLTLFAANFANGAVAAVAPDIRAGSLFLIAFASITGLASGALGGRAVRTAVAPATA